MQRIVYRLKLDALGLGAIHTVSLAEARKHAAWALLTVHNGGIRRARRAFSLLEAAATLRIAEDFRVAPDEIVERPCQLVEKRRRVRSLHTIGYGSNSHSRRKKSASAKALMPMNRT
jgi:hypothetical protein